MIDTPSPALDTSSASGESKVLAKSYFRRWMIIVSAGLIFFLVAAAFGFHLAVQKLKDHVVEALGPGGKVRELNVGWSSVELVAVSIDGPKGWPAARTFHADRVTIVPSLRTLLSDRVEIASVTIENSYLSVLRTPGKFYIVPSLLEAERRNTKAHKTDKSSREILISRIVFANGTMDLFDTTVSRLPHKIRLEQIEAVVRNVVPGNLDEPTIFELTAIAKGKSHDGRIDMTGWIAAAGKNSSSHILIEKMELATLQPYFVKKGDARVSQGSLDLNLKSEVRNDLLDGAGNMIIKDLEFAPSQNYLSTFMGLPRSAVISFLKDHDNAINLDFTLSGDMRDPNFSLNETLATRLASGMAGQLGVSIQGIAEGLEALGRKGMQGAGATAGTIGSTLRSLFTGGGSR